MTDSNEIRWHRHRFNSNLSWRLILAIVPRVPFFLRPPIQFVTTLLCITAMPLERKAAGRNLRRVTGRSGAAAAIGVFRLFYNFSKFMVTYVDLPPFGKGFSRERVHGRDDAYAAFGAEIARGSGLILLGMHLGQWDLALVELARAGIPVTVVMRREDEEAAKFAAAVRAAAGLRVVYAREDPFMMVELLATLRRGGVVAMQGDRAFGDRSARVNLFGESTEIPTGPWDLARASGAPIIPAAFIFEEHRCCRVIIGEPIRVDPGQGESSRGESGKVESGLDDSAKLAAPGASAPSEAPNRRRSDGPQRLAAAMEAMIAAHADQWFNFYDVWPDGAAKSAPAKPGDAARRLSLSRAEEEPHA